MGAILDRAATMTSNGVLSASECHQLLSDALTDGKISYGERADLMRLQTDFVDKLTPRATQALRQFLALGTVFDGNLAGKIFEVDDDTAELLEKQGVTTVAELLTRAKTDANRADLADKSGLDVLEVTNFVERADLARVAGIGLKYAAVLDRLDVNNVQQLAKQNPSALHGRIADFLASDAGKKIASRGPSLSTVERWVEASQILPYVLRYAGDSGENFSLTAWGALDNSEKTRLLLGWDVTTSAGGSVRFEAESITIEPVERRTAEVKAFIERVQADAVGVFPDFEWELEGGVVFDKVVRAKLDDDTIGYRATFDVNLSGDQEYGWEGYEDMPEFGGLLTVVLDKDGSLLGFDYEDTFDRYGNSEWDW